MRFVDILASYRRKTADETSVASAFAFIQTVAAIVIQTAVRRYQATCLAEDLSFSKRYEGDIVDSYVSKTPKGTTRQLFSEIEDDNDTINSRQALLAPNVSYESVSDSPYHGSMGDAFLSLYEQAAVRIQAVFRSFWVRDSLDVDHYCATILQKWVRRHVRRRDFEKKSRQIIIVQSWWRRNIARDYAGEIIFYVVWIQAVYRGYRARQLSQQLELLKKSKQQLQVQRALQSRREYFIQTRKEPLATKKYDCGDRLPQKDDMVAVRAAIKIQSRWRMFVCECAFIRSLVDILIAQTVVRRWLASRLVASIRRANAPSSPTENATNPVRNSVALEHMKIGDCHDPATSLDLSGPFRNDLKPESVDTGLNISCQNGSENDNLSKSIDIDEILGMADRMLVHSRDPADLDRISTRYSDTPTSENPSDESNARRTPTIDDGDLRIAPQPDGDFTGTAQNSSSVANDDISRNTISFCNVSAQPLKDIHCVGTSAKERIPRSTLEGRINEAEVILKRKGMPADASVNPSSSSPVSGTNSFRQSRGQSYTAGSRNMEQTKKAPDPAGIRLATRQSLTTDLRDIQGRFQEAKKSFNVGAAGKSRRVEQFFQKSPQSDSPNGLHLNAKPNDTARRNADLEYGSGRFDDNQEVASNQETVLDDAFTELDPLNTKNVFSVWKDKVKLSQANAGKR